MSDVNFVKVETDNVSVTNNSELPETQVNLPTVTITSESAAIETQKPREQRVTQPLINAPLSTFLQRPVKIFEQDLGPLDGFSPIASFNPWDLWSQNDAVADKLKNFKVLRGTLRITAMFTFPGNCFGSYTLSALPWTSQEGYYNTFSGLHRPNVCQVDRFARVDCAASENVQIDLPWFCQTDYLPIDQLTTVHMWELYLYALAPVRTAIAGGTAYGHVVVYANVINDFVMSIPRYQVKFSEGAQTVSNVSSLFSNVPVIGPFAHAVSGIAGHIGDVASMLGFTRRAVSPPHPGSLYSISNVATIDSDDPSLVAGLSAANSISIDPMLHSQEEVDVASFESLFARWTLVEQFLWNPEDQPGELLDVMSVSPFFSNTFADTGTGLTTAGYVGLPFEWWRGDMEYMIVIPVSKLHRGTLQVFWTSSTDHPTSQGTDPTNISPNVIHDVSSGRDLIIGVGYTMAEPVKGCRLLSRHSGIFEEFANGQLCFRVVNPLRSQLGETQTPVHVLVFARAASNMQFGYLSDDIHWYDTESDLHTYQRSTSVWYQGGASGDEDLREPVIKYILPPSGEYPLKDVLMGESVRSVRALMQKPSHIPLESGYATNRIPRGGPVFTNTMSLFDGLLPSTPLPCHYRLLFAAVAGSERVKLNLCEDANVSVHRYLNGRTIYAHPLAPITYSGPQRGAEYLLPYYRNNKFVPGNAIRSQYVGGGTPPEGIIISTDSASAEGSVEAPNVFWCYGPDLRISNFAQVPELVVRQDDSQYGFNSPARLRVDVV